SGFFGGKVDQIIQRIADTIMAFPGLVFLIAAVSVLGAGGNLVKTFLAIGILLWPGENRVVRSTVLAIKQNAYIEAARAIGATNQRILLRHILPNVAPIVIIVASIAIGGAILLDASLGFLGLGTVYPRASWGGMLSSGGRTYMKQAPWLALAPGFAISIAVWSFNMFGDAMRDALDPRMRGSR
ncbi:MAG: ABC transporter permease, partial [Chloroflexi bacterium]|nr:ABC transporter permease [Chloroflexota bacterium]